MQLEGYTIECSEDVVDKDIEEKHIVEKDSEKDTVEEKEDPHTGNIVTISAPPLVVSAPTDTNEKTAEPQYEAVDHFISDPEILSHDAQLNQNGDALYRFLMERSQEPPQYRIRASGTHTEVRRRTVRVQVDGKWRTEQEVTTVTVPDFYFSIDLTPCIVRVPIHWTLADNEPAYRGQPYRQVNNGHATDVDLECGAKPGLQKASGSLAKNRKEYRRAHGLPPWRGPDFWYEKWDIPIPDSPEPLQSSTSLREWADQYCKSKKILKEFTYTKVVFGWDLEYMRDAVTSAIRETYSHDIVVDFDMYLYQVRVIPDNALARTLSHTTVVVLLWLLLIYPFVWLFKRYSSRGGGRWKVAGAAYALALWQPAPAGGAAPPADAVFAPGTCTTVDGRWKKSAKGEVLQLVGETEDEWLARWGPSIKWAVRQRIMTETALRGPGPAVGAHPHPVESVQRPAEAYVKTP